MLTIVKHLKKKDTSKYSHFFCILNLISCHKDEVATSEYLEYQTIAELELPLIGIDSWYSKWS